MGSKKSLQSNRTRQFRFRWFLHKNFNNQLKCKHFHFNEMISFNSNSVWMSILWTIYQSFSFGIFFRKNAFYSLSLWSFCLIFSAKAQSKSYWYLTYASTQTDNYGWNLYHGAFSMQSQWSSHFQWTTN